MATGKNVGFLTGENVGIGGGETSGSLCALPGKTSGCTRKNVRIALKLRGGSGDRGKCQNRVNNSNDLPPETDPEHGTQTDSILDFAGKNVRIRRLRRPPKN